MFSRVGASAIKKDLTNTIAFCKHIKDPQEKFKTIHIAGTNGKGSVSSYLASVLQESGYKVGLYTSPHLVDFRERIKINGKYISRKYIIQFVAKHQNFIELLQPSFFEATVAMAFDYFAQQKVDIAIIETGLGGRLDSTNIITPILSVITNIGFDHMDLLGNTLPKIAYEKAGIIKPNVPVVIGKALKETLPIFTKKAAATKSHIILAAKLSKTTIIKQQIGLLKLNIKSGKKSIHIQTPLSGGYQIENINTSYTALQQVKPALIRINDKTLQLGFKNVIQNVGLFGRFQVLQKKPYIIADVAHNAHGMQQLLKQIKQYDASYKKIALVIGFVKDKDINACLQLIPKKYTLYVTKANIPRALPTNELAALCTQHKLKPTVASHVNKAIILAKLHVGNNGLVVVCGSIFVVGEIKGITNHK
jgi:dihydrofolate synthase / folylpolyglutamate synthase